MIKHFTKKIKTNKKTGNKVAVVFGTGQKEVQLQKLFP